MVTTQQIKERLKDEKDPLQYLDGEIARCANQLGNQCGNIQETISIYNNRVDKNDEFDLQKIKEELINIGELYYDINSYQKVRKDQVKQQKRAEQLNNALAKRQKLIEQKNKKGPNE
jgi:hypothetical protein